MTSSNALRSTAHPSRIEYSERRLASMNGYAMVIAAVVLAGIALSRFVSIEDSMDAPTILLTHVLPGALSVLATVAIVAGLYTLQPNEAAIMTLFGQYSGTDRAEGLRWANPFFIKRRISLRARNLNSPALKVNDKRGNPVEIGAVIIWRVEDSAKARFEVDDVDLYVKLQSEAALRHVASLYAYDEADSDDAQEITLRGGLDAVALALQTELSARFASAGDAAPPAGRGRHQRAPQDRAGRGGDGRGRVDGAQRAQRRHPGRRAQGGDGQQPAGGAVRRQGHAAHHQRRHALQLRP
jgi:hypothetical protein